MSAATPLLFRPSLAQRTIVLLLFAGSWLVGIRGLLLVLVNVPKVLRAIRVADYHEEPTLGLYLALFATLLVCVMGGLILLGALLTFLLVEGSQVLVDELGLAVEHNAFPRQLAKRIGAGRLTWKQITALEKGRVFFRLKGGGDSQSCLPLDTDPPVLRFLIVDQLDRLVLIIVERSPNLSFKD